MARAKKEINPSENTVYQNIRTILVSVRQKAIEGDHYYVELIFYNYMLRCFVAIDLNICFFCL